MTALAPLPLCYAAEPTREREVALYIDGQYVTRGPASEAVNPARYGYRGWQYVPADRLTFELDAPAWKGDKDRPCLCWGGARMSAADFLAWYRSVTA